MRAHPTWGNVAMLAEFELLEELCLLCITVTLQDVVVILQWWICFLYGLLGYLIHAPFVHGRR